jgi:tetratricopeptide (TPR) repeat protein
MKLKIIFKTLSILLIFSGITINSNAQNENKFIRQGNRAFEEGDFKKAEIDYRKALDKNQKSVKGEYNLGGAIYKQENYEEAQRLYEQLASNNLTPEQKAMTYHNLGNSFLQMQKPEPAIAAYKNALRNNPNDLDTKYNLEFAKKMLKQQQQQQQQQNKDQNKDQENKDQNKDQKNQDQQNQDQDKDQQNQDQQQNQQQSQDNQDKQQPQQMKQISKEDAERMLQALQDNEKKTLEKLKLEKLKNAKKVRTEKDW